jgi:hypothetical protein
MPQFWQYPRCVAVASFPRHFPMKQENHIFLSIPDELSIKTMQYLCRQIPMIFQYRIIIKPLFDILNKSKNNGEADYGM